MVEPPPPFGTMDDNMETPDMDDYVSIFKRPAPREVRKSGDYSI